MPNFEIIYRIATDLKGLEQGVQDTVKNTDKIDQSVKKTQKSVEGLGTSLVAAFGVEKIGEAIKGLAEETISFSSHLVDLRAKTGIALEGLQLFGIVGKQNGIDLETIAKAANKLGVALAGGGSSVKDAVSRLGLSFADLRKNSPEDNLAKIAEAFGGIENPAERAKLATELFGKSGLELLPILTKEFGEQYEAAKRLGIVMSDDVVESMKRFDDQMIVVKASLMKTTSEGLAPMLPGLVMLAGYLTTLVTGAVAFGRAVYDGLFKYLILLKVAFFEWLLAVETTVDKIPMLGKVVGVSAASIGVMRERLTEAKDEYKAYNVLTDLAAKGQENHTDKVKKAIPALTDFSENAASKLIKSLAEMVEKLTPLPGKMVLVSSQVAVFGGEAAKMAAEADAMGVKVPAAVRAIADAFNAAELKKIIEGVTAKWTADLNKFNDEGGKKLEEWTKRITDSILKNDKITTDSRREALRMQEQMGLDDFSFQTLQIGKWVIDQKNGVDKNTGNWRAAYQAIEDEARAKMGLLVKNHNDAIDQMKQTEKSWSNSFIQALGQFPGVLQAAFTGGGGITGAVQSFGASFSSALGTEITQGPIGNTLYKGFSSLFDKGGKASSAIANGVQGAINAAVSLAGSGSLGDVASYASTGASIGFMIGGGIGAGVGAAIGGIVGIVKNIGADEKLINATRESFVIMSGGIGQLDKAAKAAGTSLNAMLNAKNANEYQKAIQDLTEKLGFQTASMATLDDTVKKYGFTISELGPALSRQNLDKQAQQLYQDWTVLNGAGVDTVAISKRMGQSVSDYFNTALKAGVEIPKSMQPMLETMIANGDLLDANGNKITDLSKTGATFSETMTEGFKKVVDVVQKLTDAIARGLGLAIKNVPDIEINETVTRSYREGDDPNNGSIIPENAVPMADGGMGRVAGPTLFFSKGNEDFAFSGEGQKFGRGSQDALHSEIRMMRDDVRRQQMRLPTDLARAVRDEVAKVLAVAG